MIIIQILVFVVVVCLCAAQEETRAILALSRVLSSVQQRRVWRSSHGPRTHGGGGVVAAGGTDCVCVCVYV